MKIAIDAMGGDHAPKEAVLGAVEAVKDFNDIEILLVGDEQQINQYLTPHERISVLHTDEQILAR